MVNKTAPLKNPENLTITKMNINKTVKIQENSKCTTIVTIFGQIVFIFFLKI